MLTLLRTRARRRPHHLGGLFLAGVTMLGHGLAAQTAPPAAPSPPTSLESAMATAATQPSEVITAPPATLTLANRPVVQFRATVLGRTPSDRAAAAKAVLDRIAGSDFVGPVETRAVGPATLIAVGGRDVFAIVPADVETLAGETLAEATALAGSRLQAALDEVAESRRPRDLAFGAIQVLLATTVLVAIVWALLRARTSVALRLEDATRRSLRSTKVGDDEFVKSSRIIEFLWHSVTVAGWALALLAGYFWLTFSLRRFPYTRFWGESLRAFLLDRFALFGAAILAALPGLFTVLIIVVLTRFVSRIVQVFFQALEDRRITVPWIYPETAQPTRKIVSVAVWLFAVALAYPYLPGSNSEAFKGVSVFVGLMVSLGSTGLINQMMSGFTLTYSRALRKGDVVLVGDIEGTVAQLGTLATKIRTFRNEDVTIPNAVVVSQTVVNYSRGAAEGVFVPTSVTIGYDVAWRQVHALLLQAAARTPGVRRDPPPSVKTTALEDAYVKYTLTFCLENPTTRRATLAAVHANVLDAFNEYGVQITSPRYEADPATRKVVPPDQWYAAPAQPDPPRDGASSRTP